MLTASAFRETLKIFLSHEGGATSIEYGLLAAGMATAVITAFSSLSEALQQGFQGIGTLINPPIAAGAPPAL